MVDECIATGTEATDDGVWHDEQGVEKAVRYDEECMLANMRCTEST